MTLLYSFSICLFASAVGGVCGVGGGVIIKPALDAAGIMSVPVASFLSGLTVLAMSAVSLARTRERGALDVSVSVPMGVGAAAGGVLGKMLFEAAKRAAGNDALVGTAQAVTLGLMILLTLVYTLFSHRVRPRHVARRAPVVCIGLMLGVFSSFLGIGGGPMNLTALSYFFSMDTKKAAVNSLMIILLSQLASLAYSLAAGSVPGFEWASLVAMVGAGLMGGFLSAIIRPKLSATRMKRLFIALLCVILCICVYNAVRTA